jgi:hypothetical protein
LACSSASGEVGAPYDSHFGASGGYPPYSFSSTGTLPPGLALNPSTGEVSGTPTTAGNFSFTAQVMDASGNPARNTASSQCAIAVTTPPAPLSLTCPTASDPEGLPYSSSLVASGGVAPYTFSLSSGVLPPGLALNASTGAISGTDSTATGTFAFTAKVTDSSGNASAGAAVNCSLVAFSPGIQIAAVKGTTPQSTAINKAFGTNLAVVATYTTPFANQAPRVQVLFSVNVLPNGPSGVFAGGETEVKVWTDAKGVATAPALTANGMPGTFTVTATELVIGLPVGSTVTFTLTNNGPLPFTILTGLGQTAKVNTKYRNPLTARVIDKSGAPVPNWPVTFSAPIVPSPGVPLNSPSGFFLPGNKPVSSLTLTTDQNGNVSVPAQANTFAGSYNVTVMVSVPLPPAYVINQTITKTYRMNNEAGAASSIQAQPPNPPPAKTANPTVIGGVYFANMNTQFNPLVVLVTDQYGNPVSGQAIIFQIQGLRSGPGANFGNAGPKNSVSATTDDNGLATATPTANGISGGNYTVTATAVDDKNKALPILGNPVIFQLYNSK